MSELLSTNIFYTCTAAIHSRLLLMPEDGNIPIKQYNNTAIAKFSYYYEMVRFFSSSNPSNASGFAMHLC